MKALFLIPARGGSKGIPYKNIKLLNGRPLIAYTVDVARQMAHTEQDVCVSTDDVSIAGVVESLGIGVPFLRPKELASDYAGSYDVILHAINFYEKQGRAYDVVVLLQPTSPFRKVQHVREAMALFERCENIEMVVSVKAASSNPYYDCYEESSDGFLHISKGDGRITRRQDAPSVWEYNGAIYVLSVAALKQHDMADFTRIVPYVMDDRHSVDIDTPLDWEIAELLLTKGLAE